MTGRLQGKPAIITGACTGLGPMMGEMFVGEGARVLLAARREDLVVAAAQPAGGGAIGMRADVTVEDDVAAMVSRAIEEFGHVDILGNKAAAAHDVANLAPFLASDYSRTITGQSVPVDAGGYMQG